MSKPLYQSTSDENPRYAAAQLFNTLKTRHEDYWQEFLIALHDHFADEFLSDSTYEPGRYLTDLERRTLHTCLSGYAAAFAAPRRFPSPEDVSDAADGNVREFGACPICRASGAYLNVHRDHWFYCDLHNVRWNVGSNLFSSWQHESEATWRRNAARLEGFTIVDPWYPAAHSPTP